MEAFIDWLTFIEYYYMASRVLITLHAHLLLTAVLWDRPLVSYWDTLYWCPRPDKWGTELFFSSYRNLMLPALKQNWLWPIQKNHKLFHVLTSVYVAFGDLVKLLWREVKASFKNMWMMIRGPLKYITPEGNMIKFLFGKTILASVWRINRCRSKTNGGKNITL